MLHRWNFEKTRTVLTTWPFVACLFALIVNDEWLKSAYPGLLTGKLSDFAGVAVVSLLVLSVEPCRRPFAYGLIIVSFVWWKSPFSQPAIDTANVYLSRPIGRVVDYFDLAALVVLPVCALVISRLASFSIPWAGVRRTLQIPILALVVLGLTATSIIKVRQDYDVRQPVGSARLVPTEVSQIISNVAKEFRMKCMDCAASTTEAHYVGRGLSLSYSFDDEGTFSFQVEAEPGGLILLVPGKSADERANELRDKVKLRLGAVYNDLDYLEKSDK